MKNDVPSASSNANFQLYNSYAQEFTDVKKMLFVVNRSVNTIKNLLNTQGVAAPPSKAIDDLIRYNMSSVEEVADFDKLVTPGSKVEKQLVNVITMSQILIC